MADPSRKISAQALRAMLLDGGELALLDVREASESLVARQRSGILASLGLAVLLLVGVVALALRSRARVLRVLAPMAITTLVVIAALSALGYSLTLFHLISLMLVAGLGLDYALFFEHAAGDREEQPERCGPAPHRPGRSGAKTPGSTWTP